jgi:quercetin dioxygenase-like cupin family protein
MERRTIVKRIALLLCLAVAVATTGAAIATPGAGVSSGTLGRATIEGKFKMRSEGVADAVIRQVVVAAGGTTGWHTHPGPVLVIVTSGALTLYDSDDESCSGTTYGAGQGFIDPGYGHVHIARNESTSTAAQFIAVFFDVPVGGATTLDAADPGNCIF